MLRKDDIATVREMLRNAEYFDSEDGADKYLEAVFALSLIEEEIAVLRAELAEAREASLAEVAMLRRCLSEHHAQGVLDGVLAGDRCPVCANWLAESNWDKRLKGAA